MALLLSTFITHNDLNNIVKRAPVLSFAVIRYGWEHFGLTQAGIYIFVAGAVGLSLSMLGGCGGEEGSAMVAQGAQRNSLNIVEPEKVQNYRTGQVFSTWRGSLACADTSAVAWLIRRFVDRDAEFRFYERDALDMEGTLFSVPEAELQVSPRGTTFEAVMKKYGLDDPALALMARIIRDIDINKWGDKATQEAKGLEALFRGNTIVSNGDDYDQLENGFVILDCLYADLRARAGN